MVRKVLSENLEAIIWFCAFVWLALSDPVGTTHFTLCPLRNLGIDFCPGCGLGRAVTYALHGELTESLRQHLLGIPAIVILVARIATLARDAFKRYTMIDHFAIYQRNLYAQRHAVDADTRRG